MVSLAFRALDQNIVNGLADHPAIDLDGPYGRARLTYAQLLERSAALAGGLRAVGVEDGTRVAVLLPHGLEEVVTVLALARLGAVPDSRAPWRVEGVPPHLHAGEQSYDWQTLLKAGASDPQPAPAVDAEGYEELVRGEHDDVFAALTAGGTIS